MKIIELEQNSQPWHAWRKSGFSASEAPAVMAESAYFPKTPFELYLVHTGQKEVVYNSAMADGHKFEDKIVGYASDKLKLDFKPACVQNGEFIASLDGLGFVNDKPIVLEVKTTSFNSKIWRNGKTIYKWQLVHQALVCDVDQVFFGVYAKDTDQYQLEPVAIKDSDKALLKAAWHSFGKCMENFKAPELVPGIDYVENTSEAYKQLAGRFKMLNQGKKELEREIANVKAELLKISDGRQMKGFGVSIFQVVRKGTIDYSRVPQLQGVDLEPYRNDGSSYWVIK